MQLEYTWPVDISVKFTMVSSRVASVFLLSVAALQSIEGIQGATNATDTCVYFVSDDVGTNKLSGSESEQDDNICCNYRNCMFRSFFDALNNITSDVIINITTDVSLVTYMKVENVDNVKIIGHGNATVHCNGLGAVTFVSCTNVSIEGVTWERCGINSTSKPAIGFYATSNISIQDSSFHCSTGQAIVLSNVLGKVTISNCNFTLNNGYKGHGTALHYSSGNSTQPSKTHMVTINNCNFTRNGFADSIIFIGHAKNDCFSLRGTVFISNKGVPIYVSHTVLVLSDNVLFEQNEANSGGGIYSNNSAIIFRNSNAVFSRNSVIGNGGAIYLFHSKLLFEECPFVQFDANIAALLGGAIYVNQYGNVLFGGITALIFTYNIAENGGAIYIFPEYTTGGDGNVVFIENCTFEENKASSNGGAVATTSYALFRPTGLLPVYQIINW